MCTLEMESCRRSHETIQLGICRSGFVMWYSQLTTEIMHASGSALSGAGFRVFGEMVSGPMVDAPVVIKQDDLAALTKSVTGFTLTMNVDYPSESLATIVKTTLAVDPELQPDKVQREMSVQGSRLCVTFTSVEARFLRASFSAFMDLLVLATRTVEQFGPSSSYGQHCNL